MQNNKKTPQQQESSQGFDFVKAIKAFGLGAAVISGLVLLATRSARASKARKSNSKSMQQGTAESVATLIRKSLSVERWQGTDEEKLRQQFLLMPSFEFYTAVGKEYERQNSTLKQKASMETDLKKDLTTSEFEELMAIINSKPRKTGGKTTMLARYDGWARRLKAAFELSYGPFGATDTAALKTVLLEIPSRAAWVQVKSSYYRIYKRSLDADLKDELFSWEYPSYKRIIDEKK